MTSDRVPLGGMRRRDPPVGGRTDAEGNCFL